MLEEAFSMLRDVKKKDAAGGDIFVFISIFRATYKGQKNRNIIRNNYGLTQMFHENKFDKHMKYKL
jgi:hypothetical protein